MTSEHSHHSNLLINKWEQICFTLRHLKNFRRIYSTAPNEVRTIFKFTSFAILFQGAAIILNTASHHYTANLKKDLITAGLVSFSMAVAFAPQLIYNLYFFLRYYQYQHQVRQLKSCLIHVPTYREEYEVDIPSMHRVPYGYISRAYLHSSQTPKCVANGYSNPALAYLLTKGAPPDDCSLCPYYEHAVSENLGACHLSFRAKENTVPHCQPTDWARRAVQIIDYSSELMELYLDGKSPDALNRAIEFIRENGRFDPRYPVPIPEDQL